MKICSIKLKFTSINFVLLHREKFNLSRLTNRVIFFKMQYILKGEKL